MSDDNRLMLKIAKKYFFLHQGQEEIAIQEGVSKSTVSRMLAKAEKMGYITYQLNFPMMGVESLEQELQEALKLKHVHVSAVDIDDPAVILRDVVASLAAYLNTIVKDGDTIGVSWGNTMNEVASQLEPIDRKGVSVVQLNGGISRNIIPTNAEEIVSTFANNYNGIGYILPVPAFVDSSKIVEALLEDSRIREVFEMMKNAQIAVFSVGSLDPDSILINAGYFTNEQYDELRKSGFVADVCTRYFNIKGEMPANHINDDRVLGISPELLKEKRDSICIAIGKKKVNGIIGVARGGYANTLFTDEKTAREILNSLNRQP
ncbi:MAG: sugar-binding transcriptional regulator [Eubacteriales bacterium]